MKLVVILVTASLSLSVRGEEDLEVHSAVIESCGGWRLNKLKDVKSFIFGEFQTDYLRTSFTKIPGKSPEIVFYNVDNQEIERIPIDKMTREELNELMVDKGIEKKEKEETDRSEHDEI